MPVFRSAAISQFVRFVAVGFLNTIFGYSVFMVLTWCDMNTSAALLVSTALGVMFNFVTTGRLVFNSSNLRQIGRFAAAYGVVYLINLAMLNALRSRGIAPISAQGLCLPVIVPLSFIFQKLFVFREVTDANH